MTGRVSDAAIYVRNSRTGEGFAVINEAPGYLKCTEIGDSWNSRISVMYDTDRFPSSARSHQVNLLNRQKALSCSLKMAQAFGSSLGDSDLYVTYCHAARRLVPAEVGF